MVSDDFLIREKWVEWYQFNKEWSNRSVEDYNKWLSIKTSYFHKQ
jgi:hypothetical protein